MIDNDFSLSSAPLTNRGVQSTIDTFSPRFEPKLNTSMLIDWLQVTIFPFGKHEIEDEFIFFNEKVKEQAYKDLGYIERDDKAYKLNSIYDIFYYLFKVKRPDILFNVYSPLYGYQYCYSYKDIKILCSDVRPEMGVHILISGTACRQVEDLGVSWEDIFYKIKNYQPNYTRIDVSFDDYTGDYWTLQRIAKCIENKEVVTRFRSALSISKEDLNTLQNIGYTIQFGSRSSDIQFTFYDKLKERRCNNYLVDENITHWNRFETRFRNDNARSVVDNLLYQSHKYNFFSKNCDKACKSFSHYIISVINNYICFKVYSNTDKKRCRWKTQPWWRDFIENCYKIKLQNKPIEFSITRKRAWLDRSVSFSNFCVMLADIPDLKADDVSSKYLYDLFQLGYDRLTKRDLQYINEYRLKNGLNVFDMQDIDDYVKSVKDILIRS